MICPVCQIDNEEVELAVHLMSTHGWGYRKVMEWMRERNDPCAC